MVKHGLFLDTQICIDIARGAIPQDEWQRIWHYILRNFQYFISPLSLIELLRGIAYGQDVFFHENLEALRVLVPTHKRKRFLVMPGHFVLESVLSKKPRESSFRPRDFEQWTRVIFKGPTRKILESGGVRLPHIFSKGFGFSFDTIAEQHEKGLKTHVERLRDLREGKLVIPSRFSWAAGLLRQLGEVPNHEDCAKLANALDAAYEFQAELWSLVKTTNYNFEKHRTDWIDQQQLYYLSIPRMHFLTSDKRIKDRTERSFQNDRILVYKEFKRSI